MEDTSKSQSANLFVKLTSDIVAAYVGNHVVPVSELPTLIADVHGALSLTSAPVAIGITPEKLKPAVSVRKAYKTIS